MSVIHTFDIEPLGWVSALVWGWVRYWVSVIPFMEVDNTVNSFAFEHNSFIYLATRGGCYMRGITRSWEVCNTPYIYLTELAYVNDLPLGALRCKIFWHKIPNKIERVELTNASRFVFVATGRNIYGNYVHVWNINDYVAIHMFTTLMPRSVSINTRTHFHNNRRVIYSQFSDNERRLFQYLYCKYAKFLSQKVIPRNLLVDLPQGTTFFDWNFWKYSIIRDWHSSPPISDIIETFNATSFQNHETFVNFANACYFNRVVDNRDTYTLVQDSTVQFNSIMEYYMKESMRNRIFDSTTVKPQWWSNSYLDFIQRTPTPKVNKDKPYKVTLLGYSKPIVPFTFKDSEIGLTLPKENTLLINLRKLSQFLSTLYLTKTN